MPTRIECSYLEQGYRLPEGFSWAMIAERRRTWGIDPMFVPVAVAPGSVGWGVPFIDGRPLKHPKRRASRPGGQAGRIVAIGS